MQCCNIVMILQSLHCKYKRNLCTDCIAYVCIAVVYWNFCIGSSEVQLQHMSFVVERGFLHMCMDGTNGVHCLQE